MTVDQLRSEFPQLERTGPRGGPLVYLDSAATSLKPKVVIDAMADVLSRHVGGVHRAVHFIGDEATEAYEDARRRIAWHIGAEASEIAFTRNTTDALNLVAAGWPEKGRRIVNLSDHHSSLLPWGDNVTRLVPTELGTLDVTALERELDRGGVSIVSLSHVSNVTGAEIDARAVADRVHAAGALLVLDCAQSIPHRQLDVDELGCDFLAFSGHKMCGPAGIGVLFGRSEHFERLVPRVLGGGMVESVGLEGHTLLPAPFCFEAGTPAVETAVGLARAVDFLIEADLDEIEAHQRRLTQYALGKIGDAGSDVRLLGPADETRVGAVSLIIPDETPHRLARLLSDSYGICVRSGAHCAEPLHQYLNITASLRLSFYLYNTEAEIDLFFQALREVRSFARAS